jgi:hypothetical protein
LRKVSLAVLQSFVLPQKRSSYRSKLECVGEAGAVGFVVFVMQVGGDSPELSADASAPGSRKMGTMCQWKRFWPATSLALPMVFADFGLNRPLVHCLTFSDSL